MNGIDVTRIIIITAFDKLFFPVVNTQVWSIKKHDFKAGLFNSIKDLFAFIAV